MRAERGYGGWARKLFEPLMARLGRSSERLKVIIYLPVAHVIAVTLRVYRRECLGSPDAAAVLVFSCCRGTCISCHADSLGHAHDVYDENKFSSGEDNIPLQTMHRTPTHVRSMYTSVPNPARPPITMFSATCSTASLSGASSPPLQRRLLG